MPQSRECSVEVLSSFLRMLVLSIAGLVCRRLNSTARCGSPAHRIRTRKELQVQAPSLRPLNKRNDSHPTHTPHRTRLRSLVPPQHPLKIRSTTCHTARRSSLHRKLHNNTSRHPPPTLPVVTLQTAPTRPSQRSALSLMATQSRSSFLRRSATHRHVRLIAVRSVTSVFAALPCTHRTRVSAGAHHRPHALRVCRHTATPRRVRHWCMRLAAPVTQGTVFEGNAGGCFKQHTAATWCTGRGRSAGPRSSELQYRLGGPPRSAGPACPACTRARGNRRATKR